LLFQSPLGEVANVVPVAEPMVSRAARSRENRGNAAAVKTRFGLDRVAAAVEIGCLGCSRGDLRAKWN
jgi:hypothetical protein